ncbi:MAG: hypothetical protein WEE64_00500 [Dehalococcoidia bacterium]
MRKMVIGQHAGAPDFLSESGQALVLALAALAVGALLVTPFLTHVSVNLLASRRADEAINDNYAADAGIEWGLWRLRNDPLLTASASYVEAPLQPTPVSINNEAFPTTQVRRVPGANATQTAEPAWQGGTGVQCYPFTSAEDGVVSVILQTSAAGVQADLRSSCSGAALPALPGPSPYLLQYLRAAGSYQLVVQTTTSGSGSVSITFPAASYDLRADRDGSIATVRTTAGNGAVEVISWQLD